MDIPLRYQSKLNVYMEQLREEHDDLRNLKAFIVADNSKLFVRAPSALDQSGARGMELEALQRFLAPFNLPFNDRLIPVGSRSTSLYSIALPSDVIPAFPGIGEPDWGFDVIIPSARKRLPVLLGDVVSHTDVNVALKKGYRYLTDNSQLSSVKFFCLLVIYEPNHSSTPCRLTVS